MKRLLLLICVGLGYIAATTAQSVSIYGYRTYQRTEIPVSGPVKFQSDAPGLVSLIDDQSDKGHVYGGTYYNYKWYGQVTVKGTQSQVDGWYTIDLTTGERTLSGKQGSYVLDVTVDYTDHTFYGLANNNKSIYTIDRLTGATDLAGTVTLADGSSPSMLTLAADIDGTLYAVTADDNLLRIDKETMKASVVGSLGVDAAFTSSMAFDHNNGVLYWSNACDECIYTIDKQTGKATLVGQIGQGYDTVNALAIPYIDVAKGSPDRVGSRTFKRDGSTVLLSWTAPVTDAQGSALDQPVLYSVYRDGQQVATGLTATRYSDENVPDGIHAYRIVPYNSKGEGGVDSDDLTVAVGPDAPGAVEEFVVTSGDGAALLSWREPTTSKNGGDFSASSITSYVITRISDRTSKEITVDAPATGYSDQAPVGIYTYTIAAVNRQGVGEISESGPVLVKPEAWILQYPGEAIVQPGKTYTFYDSGGPAANYSNSESSTIVIRPADGNGYVNVKFSSFSTEDGYDILTVYDGESTSSQLIGKFSGSTLPPELSDISATNPQGALTFSFSSDIMSTETGWTATVEYVGKKTYDLSAVDITGPANPNATQTAVYTVGMINRGLQPVNGSDYEVRLLAEDGSIVGSSGGVDISPAMRVNIDVNYTPSHEGEHSNLQGVIIYDADEDPSNNTTRQLPIMVLGSDSRVIRTATSDEDMYVVPASFMADASISESIYTADILSQAKGCNIQSISYFMSAERSYPNIGVEIYIGETDKTDLSDNIPVYAGYMTKVFDGNAEIKSGDTEWSFTLKEPYLYTGKNLVVMFSKYGSNTDLGDVVFCGSYNPGAPERSIFDNNYFDSSIIRFDPDSFSGTTGSMIPDLKLVVTIPAGVSEISVDRSIKIQPVYEGAMVEGAEGMPVCVFSSDGRMMRHIPKASGIENIKLPSGLYIISAGTTVTRIVVR